VHEIRSRSLVDRVIHLHNLADGEIFVRMLHHLAQDIRLSWINILYLSDDGFCCALHFLLLLKELQEICQGLANA